MEKDKYFNHQVHQGSTQSSQRKDLPHECTDFVETLILFGSGGTGTEQCRSARARWLGFLLAAGKCKPRQ